MKKPAFCICTKGADQLHGNRAADRRLHNRYIDSTATVYLLNPEFQAPSPSYVVVRPGLCRNCSKILIRGFHKAHGARLNKDKGSKRIMT